MTTNTYGSAHHVCRWLAAAALALVPLIASAQISTLDRTRMGGGHIFTGNGTTYTAGNVTAYPPTGSMQVPPGAATGTVTGNFSHGTAGDGSPAARSRANMPIPGSNGRTVPIDTTAKYSKASAAKAIGSFAAKVIGPLAIGKALYDLAKDMGWKVTNDDGQPGVEVFKPNPNFCGADCYVWRTDGKPETDAPSQAESCQLMVGVRDRILPGGAPHRFVSVGPGGGIWPGSCVTAAKDGAQQVWNQGKVAPRSPDPESARYAAAQLQEFQDAIAAQSGWPTSASRAVADALNDTSIVVPPFVDLMDPALSGPASVAGPSSTTTEPTADGGRKETTATTTYNFTFNGNTFNTTVTTTTTTNTYNSSNVQTGSSTKTDSKEAEKKCEAGTSECDGETPPEGSIPKTTKNVAYTQENMGWGAGACPANPTWTDRLGTHTVDITPYCDKISSVVRPVVLAFAALMALAICAPGFRMGDD